VAKVFFWTAGTSDACTFYRCAEPGRVLRALGHDVTWHQQAGLADLMMADVVVIQRPTEVPPQHVMAKLLALPEGKRPRIVVELDDDLFSLPEHHAMHAALADPARRHRLTEAIAHADRVTVTNPHLAGQVMDWTRHPDVVRVVPNYVPERFVVEKVPELGPIGTPVITWAGSDTHRRDFDLVAVALRKLLRERTDFRVRIVGAPYAARLTRALSPAFPGGDSGRISQVPWIEGVDRYIPTLAGHIGLAPLADDLFNRSKSDLRLKELAARGMAVAASDAGPYTSSSVPHLHVDGAELTWGAQLNCLLDDAWRRPYAEDAHAWAQENTLEAHAVEWEKALLD
jgi:glycosyltransferase involved in cell wall biosynthesis